MELNPVKTKDLNSIPQTYYFMASKSKEEQILKLILENSPSKHWHFEEIVKNAKMTRAAANKWLKRYKKEKLIKTVKEKKRFPYFIVGNNNPVYQSKKRIYALNKLYQSGFISHLMSLKKAKTIIIFGSIVRWDWYKESDIDLFIFGDAEDLHIGKYELKLHRDIQVFICKDKKDLYKFGQGLIRNIIEGYTIKGDIPMEMIRNAGF